MFHPDRPAPVDIPSLIIEHGQPHHNFRLSQKNSKQFVFLIIDVRDIVGHMMPGMIVWAILFQYHYIYQNSHKPSKTLR